MSDSLVDTTRDLLLAATGLGLAVREHDWTTAEQEARAIMRLVGSIHTRVRTLSELQEDGYHIAAVDRAVQRANGARAIPEDPQLPFDDGGEPGAAARKRSPKGKPPTPARKRPAK